MKTYRQGRHWGVTVVEETWAVEPTLSGRPDSARLVATATSATDAEAICEALNWVHRLAAANGREIVDIMREIRGEAV